MRCLKHCVFTSFSTLLLVFLPFHFPTAAADGPLWTSCSSTPSSSTFAFNLNYLLSSLPSGASATNTGFANGTVGRSPDTVYGLAQCRGDTKGDKCLQCLDTAREGLLNGCQSNRTGVIWYDNCLMRYSDTQISSTFDNSPLLYMWNLRNVTEPAKFNRILGAMMKGLVSKITSVPPGAPLYATDKADFNDFQTLYGLAQCNSNLFTSHCRICLGGAISDIPNCCDGKQGGRVIGVNCNIRFELYQFFEDSAASNK